MAHKNDNQVVMLEEALTRFIDECLQGEKPDIDEFARQYPQCEAKLKKRIRDLHEIDFLFDSIVRADETEFVDIAAHQDLVGQKLASFEVERVIGQGGMGVVYLARDTKLDRHVAIKSMPAGLLSTPTDQTRLKREAKVLASLNHPNIAVIHDIIEQDDYSGYLVLEYVPGETLSERIKRETLTMDEALSIGRQIAEAVSAAHKKGIVHRDLKPGNIKVTPEGRIKVLDFGLAKPFAREGKSDEITTTHPGRVIGTPAYMSPEQARGKDTDHRTDIWSFGCMMYQMLTGQLPFEGETTTDTLARIIEREPDWDLLPRNTPANIRKLLRRCLEKTPKQRLGDIDDAIIEMTETLGMPKVTLPVRLRRKVVTIGLTVIVVLSGVAVWFALGKKDIWVVVLPFETLKSVEDEDVTAGITSEITDYLAKIHGLSVISYRSARQYKQTNKTTQQIADELHVDYILEGAVQYEHPLDANSLDSLVSITSRLINISDNAQVWSDTYDCTMKEVSKIPFDMAKEIAQATDIHLSPAELQALAYKPTYHTEAYACYVRGNSYFPRQNYNDFFSAIEWYEKATELDDEFALAHAKLSVMYTKMYRYRDDRTEERLTMALDEANRALELVAGLPEAHWARGVYYFWGRSDFVRALDEFTIARKAQPDNSEFLAWIGYVQRQQGQYEQALTNLKRAFELNPRDYRLTSEIGNTYRDMGQYPEAELYYEQAIVLARDEHHPYYLKAWLYVLWKGSIQEARDVLEKASQYVNNLVDRQSIFQLLLDLDLLEENYEEALAQLPFFSPSADELVAPFDAQTYAYIYEYMGKTDLAEKHYNKARSLLEFRLKKSPNGHPGYHQNLGIVYAALGLKEEAIREGIKGKEIVLDTKEFQSYFVAEKALAIIYMKVGDFDAAIDQIEYMLTFPGRLSIPLLQIDPLWDPLRNHPRFQKLIESEN